VVDPLPAGEHGLRPEDRADFEAVLHRALNTPEIRAVLRADPSGLAARRLWIRALADAEETTAAAQDEYRAYLTAIASATEAERSDAGRRADAGLLPLLAVLTPSLAACSAVAVLVLGHLLRLAGVQGTLPGSLISAGWTLALVAAISALMGLAALFRTALRGRDGDTPRTDPEQARLTWQQALLKRGILPHLRRCIHEDPSLHPDPSAGPDRRQKRKTGPACSD
jgi:hypothetical protein